MTIASIADRVRGALQTRDTDCPMEEVVGLCPDFTWNQVFRGIDHLSRTGQIRVSISRRRTYMVKVLQSTR
ncbi:MAG TPA: hypothetical protein VKP13_18955 [Nitrospira sp.]|nr:hypothetical protein [Nitrospira sp.]